MNIQIQASHDKKVSIEVCAEDCTPAIKEKIVAAMLAEDPQSSLASEEIRLIFSGKILKDADSVGELKIKDGSTVHMVRSKKKATGAGVSKPAPTTSTTGNKPESAPFAVPMPASQNTAAHPFASLGTIPNDPQMLDGLLNNPEGMRQMIDMMASNPALMQSALAMNPAYANAPPHIKEMMSKPEFLKMALEMSIAQQQGAGGGSGFASAAGTMGQEGAAPAGNDEYMQTLASMLSSSSAQPPQTTAAASNEPPELRYADQLQKLNEMGFYDPDANIRALLATGGNVNLAIERLLQNM